MYRRTSEVTSVSRIGRTVSGLRVKERTRHDRDAAKNGSRDLRQRIAAAAAASTNVVFDIVAFHDMALAGVGAIATFHFMANRTASARTEAAAFLFGPDLFALSVAPLTPMPAVPARPGISAPDVNGFGTPQLSIPLEPSTVALLRTSWSLVKKSCLDAVGKSVLLNLFARRPDGLKLFGFHEDADYTTSRSFRMHASAVIRTVGACIESAGNLESVVPTLARLGRSHALVGALPEHFDVLRGCLLDALVEHLRDKFTGEIEDAWGIAFDTLASVMLAHYPSEEEAGLGALSGIGSRVVGF